MADFDFQDDGLCAENMIQFYDQSVHYADSIIFWKWNFGDPASGANNISYFEDPLHTFSTSGIYQVKLIVQNNHFCLDTVFMDVLINDKPGLYFVFDTVCVGEPTQFSIHPDSTNIGAIGSVFWDFGDGNSSTQSDPLHWFEDPGFYEVTLSIQDTSGCESALILDVPVNPLPDADFYPDPSQYHCSNDSLGFFDDSYVPNGVDIISWEWNFGDGETSDLQNPKHLFILTNTGLQTFDVTLMVLSADSCESSITKPVTIFEAPVALFEVQSQCKNSFTEFYDLTTTTSGVVSEWSWDFGDGNNSLLQNPEHVYTDTGSYNVSLVVTDINGCSDIIEDSIYIHDLQSVYFNFDTVCFGFPTTFNINTDSTDLDAILNYYWDFDNGQTSLDTNPVVTFDIDTVYNVILSIMDTNGCENQVVVPVFMHHLPALYDIKGGGSYCDNTDGVELTLDWSDESIEYELLKDGIPLNDPLILPGINYELSFDMITDPGNYTIYATDMVTGCEQLMLGTSVVEIIPTFTVYLGKDSTLCAEKSLYLDAKPVGENADDYWYEWWDDIGYNLSPLSYALAYSPNETDTVVTVAVTVTDKTTGCIVNDTIIITFQICDDITEYDKNITINVFPNPAKDELNIELIGLNEAFEISLLSIQNELLLNRKFEWDGSKIFYTKLDLSEFPIGMFVLKVSGSQYQRIFKIIHQ